MLRGLTGGGASTPPRSLFVEGRGVRLHVNAWGDPDAPVILLQHGMRDHGRSWDAIAAALSTCYHVLAPDLRGHGDSAWACPTGYHLAAFVLDLADIVEALSPGPLAAIVGHSFGGVIALRYTAAFPERLRALCVIEAIELPTVRQFRAAPRTYPDQLRTWVLGERGLRARLPRRYASMEEAVARMREAHPELHPSFVDHLTRHGIRETASGGFEWKYDNAARLRPPDDADGRDLDETLTAIACPVLLAYGDASWIPLPPEERRARLRDHRLTMFPGASHWLHHQARERFLAALVPFLHEQREEIIHA